MVINDESIGVSQLLEARTRAVPQSLRPSPMSVAMTFQNCIFVCVVTKSKKHLGIGHFLSFSIAFGRNFRHF